MNRKLELMYFKLPLFMQNIGISVYGYFWKKHRLGGIFLPEVKAAREREFYTYEQWKEYQTKVLRKLLIHAFDSVPFYGERYRSLGIDRSFLANIKLEELKLLPYTTKEDFRKYGDSTMLSSKLSKGNFEHSSGSTGTPVHIYMPDYVAQTFSALMENRVRNWAGVDYRTPRGMVGGRRIIPDSYMEPPFYRYNYVEKQTYFSAYHISEQTIGDYLNGIIENKVEWMTGYAMSNFFIADFIHKAGLKAPQLTAVITSSEKLTEKMREVISAVFGCKVFDSYSGCEACGLISESAEGELLVSPDAGIMEFIGEDGNEVSNGEVGEIVSTGLINFDQPLIRYRIGDMVRIAKDQSLKTKHQMTKIDEIIGRVEDVVVGVDGRKMVRFHGLFIGIKGLVQSQLVQLTYTDFEIKLIVEKLFYDKNEAETIISQRLESQIGKVAIKFDYVSVLPAGKNGKVKAVISNISK